jgi:hypothetical protein
MSSTLVTTTRNSSLQDIADILTTQRSVQADFVVPASQMRMHLGVLYLTGTNPILNEDGVTMTDGQYVPTSIFDEGVAAKLSIPIGFLRTMRASRIDLYDALVNGLLNGRKEKVRWLGHGIEAEILWSTIPADPRSFLIRCFTGADGLPGVARALLSDSFKLGMDNLDALTAALEGVREAGAEVEVRSCDLSERRMTVKLVAPGIQALAPTLLEGYRNPWSRTPNSELPLIFAGLVLSNSETGNGAFTLKPRAEVQVCSNGLVLDAAQSIRSVHLGGKLEEGQIDWSEDTQRKQAAVISARTRDAVATFLSEEWLAGQVRALEEKVKPVHDAQRVIAVVGKQLQFTDEHVKGILDHFIRGGSLTTAGVMNACTSYAQDVADPDVANEIEAQGLRALDLAAAIV